MEPIYISPSGLATYENCPREYQYGRILKANTLLTSCNLGFGGSVATAMESYLRGLLAKQAVDPVAVFMQHWDAFTSSNNVEYKKGYCKDVLTEIGCRLMKLLPEAWEKSGYQVLLDAQGEPMIERKLQVDLGNGVILVTKLDVVVMDRDGEVFIIDAKTPASPTSTDFTLMGDQLTAYQIAVEAHAKRLGITKISGVGYWEMIKRAIPKTSRGMGPVIMDPCVVEPRTEREIEDFILKVHDTADRIRAKRFHKTPRMAWNTPCSGCSYANSCIRGDTTGLTFRNEEAKQAALQLAA